MKTLSLDQITEIVGEHRMSAQLLAIITQVQDALVELNSVESAVLDTIRKLKQGDPIHLDGLAQRVNKQHEFTLSEVVKATNNLLRSGRIHFEDTPNRGIYITLSE